MSYAHKISIGKHIYFIFGIWAHTQTHAQFRSHIHTLSHIFLIYDMNAYTQTHCPAAIYCRGVFVPSMDFVQGPCVRSGKYLTKLLRNIDWFGSIPMIVQSAPVIHVGYAFGDWRRWFDLICRKINALHSLICFLHRSSLEILSSAMPLIKYPLSLHNSCSF